MSVRNILGAVPVVLTSPTAGPAFKKALLREKVHFVNCHGNESDHTFAGESPKDTTSRRWTRRKLEGVSKGTVAAFECCFGAELYDPAGLPAMSIANTYLAKGAAGVVASTTIAYGPFDDNANADVICQIFIEQLLRGASLGRAMLEARLAYVRQQSVVDPYDEKTLAQFVLLGDPSLHPFIADGRRRRRRPQRGQGAVHAARQQRRVRLMKAGERLSRETAYTVPAEARRAGRTATLRSKALAAVRRRFTHVRAVPGPRAGRPPQGSSGRRLKTMPKAEQVFVATRRRQTPATGPNTPPRIDGLLAYRVNGSSWCARW